MAFTLNSGDFDLALEGLYLAFSLFFALLA